MLIVEGSCDLYDFLNFLNKNENLMKKYEYLVDNKSKIFEKIQPAFIESLLAAPIIFYLEKDSITNNSFNSNFNEYIKKIEHIDNPELIIFLDKIDKSKRKDFNIKWIALELKENIDFNKTKIFKEFVSLDFNLDENSTNGRIDINNFENRAKLYLNGEGKTYFKNYRNSYMKYLYKIQRPEDKRKYVKKELLPISNFEKELEKHDKKYFKVECLFCKKPYMVSTSSMVQNAFKPKDIFELSEDKTRIVFKCDHKNTNRYKKEYISYEGKVQFSFKPHFQIDINNKIDERIYSYALLQYFYSFILTEDEKQIRFLNSNNELEIMSIEDTIKRLEKNYAKK